MSGTSLDLGRVAALAAALRRNVPQGVDTQTRRGAYALFRGLALAAGASLTDRLGVEYAVAEVEVEHSPRLKAVATRFDVWALMARQHPAWASPAPSDPAAFAEDLPPAAVGLLAATRGERSAPGHLSNLVRHLRMLVALWMRGFKVTANSDRLGYAWFLVEPAAHVAIVTAVTLFLHAPTVYDMPVYPFAVLGVCCWLMFRTATLSAMFGGGAGILQLDHPPVRRYDIAVAKALDSLITYTLVCALMMAIAMALDMADLPENLVEFAAVLAAAWLLGLSFGLILSSLQVRYEGVRRVNGLLMRLVAMTAGLFYIYEQLPPEVSYYLLWNPLLHIAQLGRSAWFAEYETVDASWTYIGAWLLALGTVGLMCAVLDDKRPSRAAA